jgi:hypothetical protein
VHARRRRVAGSSSAGDAQCADSARGRGTSYEQVAAGECPRTSMIFAFVCRGTSLLSRFVSCNA